MSHFQEWLLQCALTASDAARALNVETDDAEAWARRKRQADELFGVWSSRHGAFIYPPFQFDSGVQPERLTELLRVLRTRTGFEPAQADRGGWRRASWLYQPHTGVSQAALWASGQVVADPVAFALALRALDDTPRCPADVFADHPSVVIALALDLAMAPV